MEQHYLAIVVPETTGGWSVLFPDLPGCATHGATVREAIANASNAASAWLTVTLQLGDEIPAPKSYKEVRTYEAWARDRGIDWSTAVISLVPVTFPANDS
jgi:predicted RNase H-like HicB family nuclease